MRSVLMLTTAGKTFATANTVGSEAGSAWANRGVDVVRISSALTIRMSPRLAYCPGSARALACSSWRPRQTHTGCGRLYRMFSARAPKTAREARALPRKAGIAFIVASRLLLEAVAAIPDATRRYE